MGSNVAALLLAAHGLLGACGGDASAGDAQSAPKGPGTGCQADAECQTGLACLDPSDTFVTENDAGCTGATAHGITFCTKICESDADCEAFGADVVCAANGCGPTGICLRKSDAGVTGGHL